MQRVTIPSKKPSYKHIWRRDTDKGRFGRRRQKARNYDRGDFSNGERNKPWTARDDNMVYAQIPDREIAKALGRSVRAIQIRRYKLKQETLP